MRKSRRRALVSPILWTSIATGKVPEKHGVRDFVLPLPGTASAWIGSDDGPARGEIDLPEIEGDPPHGLRLQLRSFAPLDRQRVDLQQGLDFFGTQLAALAGFDHGDGHDARSPS